MSTITDNKKAIAVAISKSRWTTKEDDILLKALNDGNIKRLTDVNRLVSNKTGRTVSAVAARTYLKFRSVLEENFNTNFRIEPNKKRLNKEDIDKELREEVTKHISAQIHFDLLDAKKEINNNGDPDSRIIFGLYEKLVEFKELVISLREENASLRRYHELSEIEIKRLTDELSNSIDTKEKTIEQIKNIQLLVSNLSESSFGNIADEKVMV